MKIVKLDKNQFINGRERVKGEIVVGNYKGREIIKDINKVNKQKIKILKAKYGKPKQTNVSAKAETGIKK